MLLYIDIGNSNIVIGKGNGDIQSTYRYQTDEKKSSDEYYALLKHLFDDVKDVIIASVVPQINTAFKTFLMRYFNITPLFVEPGIKTGIGVKTDYPKEVGADLIAAAAGAKAHYNKTAFIVDMGTATTFSFMQDGVIRGVSITIGLDMAKTALVNNTSKLLQFEFQKPSNILGTNTIDALNAGFLYGHTYQIEGFANHVLSEYNMKDLPILMTGGAAKLLKGLLPKHYIFDEYLVLKGLAHIYKKNR